MYDKQVCRLQACRSLIRACSPQDGNEVYSCSPFHVRFGKLQVLRAGEKRV
jgi:hypothetical protein